MGYVKRTRIYFWGKDGTSTTTKKMVCGKGDKNCGPLGATFPLYTGKEHLVKYPVPIVPKRAAKRLRATETHRVIAVEENDSYGEMEDMEEVPVVEREGMLWEKDSNGSWNSDDRTCDNGYGSGSGEEEQNCDGCEMCRCQNCDTITVLDPFKNRLACRRVRYKGHRDSANLRPSAENDWHGSRAVRTGRVHHPALNEER